jgi:putative ABC transport system permease protein
MTMSTIVGPALQTRRLLTPQALVYFYRRRLRAHGTQELLAGVGIAVAVALVLAAGVAQSSIVGSTQKVLRAVIGPAHLQLRARGPEGFPKTMLASVERIGGVRQAAPLLERTIHVIGPGGHSANIYVAGTDVSLAVLNGLGKTLPLEALRPGVIGLSKASASALGVGTAGQQITLLVGGIKHTMRVSALLGRAETGALSGALVGVMPLATMQQLLGEPGRVTRILVQARHGQRPHVATGLERLAGTRLIAGGAEEDLSLLEQALRPAGQASALFAIIGALLGFLLAFNAILLTVPERRQAIADLRLSGTPRSAIVQLAAFQALCLGVAASAVGLAGGYVLSRWVLHQSSGYLAEAFAIGGGTVVPASSVLIAAAGGIAITCLASAVPLLDLRRRLPRDAIYMGEGVPGNALASGAQRWLFAGSLGLLAGASVLYTADPSTALIASVLLALATVLAVPIAFAGVLMLARALSERRPSMPTLAIALGGLQGTTLRSLALAATGAVALFGSVALGGARSNLLEGIGGFAHAYAADAPIWVGEPGDNQAVQQLAGDAGAARIGRLGDIASVRLFQGAFLTVGRRRVWVVARPPGGARSVLASQTVDGARAARSAGARLSEGGWVAVSRQIAAEYHVGVGGTLSIATPSGLRNYGVAALTSNLAWSPGALFMGTRDFSQAFATGAPSALAVRPRPGVSIPAATAQVRAALGPGSGLEVATAARREASIDKLTSEGLSQLGVISTLLVLAAIAALAAALTSSIHQRRTALASLRLSGAAPGRLRRILALEAGLMLGAGCLTGTIAGFYGQYVIDAYLRHVTGFPVAAAGASVRPIVVLGVVLAAALVLVAVPAVMASRVSPAVALAEE